MARDYIPHPNTKFDTFFKNILEYTARKTDSARREWTHIPPDDEAALAEAFDAWEGAYILTLRPHSVVETRERDRVRRESERALRAFVNRFLRYPPVTDEDRDEMRVPNRDLTRTPHVHVEETVELEIRLRNIREVLIYFRIKGSARRARPDGYDGAVLVWDVLDAPPERVSDLTRHVLAGKTPHTLTFREEDRGKTVYIAAAWQNARGSIGPWSDILSAVIP
jgi:hypothetical protein